MTIWKRYAGAHLALLFCAALLVLPADAAPRVWVDEAHGQAFKTGQRGELHLSGLAEVFQEAGWQLEAGRKRLTPELLQGRDGLIISGPFQALAPQEIDAVRGFIEQGGRVAIMLHIGPPLAGLLQSLGIVHSNGVIQERQDMIGGEAINFRASITGNHPVTNGLDGFALYGSWALLAEGENTQVLATSSSESWVDLNGNRQLDASDAQQAFAVLVYGAIGKGAFLVFADDAIFQNRFLQGDNLVLAHNLADWMRAEIPYGELAMHLDGEGHE